eukprot:Sdes_comp22579_c0_seq1m21004
MQYRTVLSEACVEKSSQGALSAPQHGVETRLIQLHSSAEVRGAPDRALVVVHVCNFKDKLADATHSVERRVNYIASVCSNHGVKMKKDYHVDRVVNRLVDGSVNGYEVASTIQVTFDDMKRCETLYNLLVSKLDDSVKIFAPEYIMSPDAIRELKRTAVLEAISTAKAKAEAMASVLGQTVLRPVHIEEKEQSEEIVPVKSTFRKGSHISNVLFSEQEANFISAKAQVFVSFEIGDIPDRKPRPTVIVGREEK